jgi:hypothetical protein
MGKLPPGKSRWRSRRRPDQAIADADIQHRPDLARGAHWHRAPYRIH